MDMTVSAGPDPDARQHAIRPFGLRYARTPGNPIDLDLDQIGYDEVRQIAVAADGPHWVPLTDHSMSVTLQTSGESPREDEIYDKSFQ
ncbi:MAG: putative ATP-grasp-modified RiPP [Actinocatenispora sp.]